VRWVLAVIPM